MLLKYYSIGCGAVYDPQHHFCVFCEHINMKLHKSYLQMNVKNSAKENGLCHPVYTAYTETP